MSLPVPRRALRAAALLFPLAVPCLAPMAPVALGAQVVVVDDGTFSLFRAGERVGREDFSIRVSRSGAGDAFIAQGNVLSLERRTTVALTADSTGAPMRFQLETRQATTLIETYAGERQRGIWSGRSVSAVGESAREIRLAGVLLLVEPGVVHQLWFVLRAGETRTLTLFAPRTLARVPVAVREVGPDRVTLGLVEIPARHWEIRPLAGGGALWEVWTDAQGRLLRVLTPADGLEAVRDEAPR